jgi:hypothetical protein
VTRGDKRTMLVLDVDRLAGDLDEYVVANEL